MSAPVTPELLVRDRRILVCVGTGGVGKTTIAASIALEAARRGRRVLVLTIDPARRLADALGISLFEDEPREVTLPDAGDRPEYATPGSLLAMMIDTKRTFDKLVERFTEDPEVRDRILANPIYQHASDTLAGSGEYAAMEKVLEMTEEEAYDLIVVDTPPSQHALDFLEAPQRMTEFFESRIVQYLVHPAMSVGRFGFKLFQRPMQKTLQVLERITGVAFLEDLSDFLLAIESMSEGFVERAARIRAELFGPRASFILVASPSRQAARNTQAFLAMLAEAKASPSGVILNRVHEWPGGGEPPASLLGDDALTAETEELAKALARPGEDPEIGREAAKAVIRATREHASQVAIDLENQQALRSETLQRGGFFRTVPEFTSDVHDITSLTRIGETIFTEAGDAAQQRGADVAADAQSPERGS